MEYSDTTKLLKECDAGIKMGVGSIEDVIDNITDDKLKKILFESKKEHEHLQGELHLMLTNTNNEGKDPNPMVKGMSWIKTEMKLAMDKSDNTIADLITDGCDMGIKSLSRYLNQYKAASHDAKAIARKLISLEEHLRDDMRDYL